MSRAVGLRTDSTLGLVRGTTIREKGIYLKLWDYAKPHDGGRMGVIGRV
jgi:hypothetical protein